MNIHSATKGKTLLIEKSRDCHNHTLQPTPDTKKKGNRACKVNKQMHEMNIVQLSYFQAGWSHKQDWQNTRTNIKARLNMQHLL